jgi:uncharacterized SAM-binding protein YcdF (DUF218 family)
MDILGQTLVNLDLRFSCAVGARRPTVRAFADGMVLFTLKKFISFWLMPVPMCLTLVGTGLILLLATKRSRPARGLLVAGFVLFALFANKIVSVALVRPIEATFPPIPELTASSPLPASLQRCRYVVVLGSGHSNSPGFSANNQLSSAALARIVEGVRLLRVLPEAKLILSGGGEPGAPTHAAVLGRVAQELGIPAERMLRIETVRDTEDEAQAVRTLVGEAPVALVTTAWHLPRAAGLFRRAGVDTLPCPTNYTARPAAQFQWSEFDWDVESLERSTAAVRERIGYTWVWLRGKV